MTPLLALQSHYLTECLYLKSSSKFLLIDLVTPLSPRRKVLLTEAKTQFDIQKLM